MTKRIILTLLLIIGWSYFSGAFSWVTHTAAPIVQGDAAVLQLAPSNTEYMIAQAGMAFHGFDLPEIIIYGLVLLMWIQPIKRLILPKKAAAATTTAALILMALLMGTSTSKAYYEVLDNPEFVNIGPNDSAFLVPVVGNNLAGQAQFGSIDYLKQKKQASKRIQIPHTSFTNAGWAGKTYFVPAAVLTIVDRTPYYQEWRDESDRGTSAKKEGFTFETKDSINITCGIAISAEVTEEDVATFLYWFGATNNGNSGSDPATQFASVIHGKSLTDIMGTVIRGKVAAVLAREFGRLATNEAIGSKDKIITTVEQEVMAFAKSKGITIDYVGFCTSLSEDQVVQDAINNRFIAEVDSQAAVFQATIMPIKQQLAEISIKNGIATAIGKWNGQLPSLPSFMVMSEGLTKWLTGITTSSVGASVPSK